MTEHEFFVQANLIKSLHLLDEYLEGDETIRRELLLNASDSVSPEMVDFVDDAREQLPIIAEQRLEVALLIRQAKRNAINKVKSGEDRVRQIVPTPKYDSTVELF